MQNPIEILDKAPLFSRNQVYCLKNWKFWQASATMELNTEVFTEILHTFFFFFFFLILFIKNI